MELNELKISEAAKLLDERKISSVELTKACLERINKTNKTLNSFLAINESALKEAEESDKRRAEGDFLGKLDGVPASIKDVILTKDLKTTASSKMLENFVPIFDATVVSKLKDQGVVILGKNNCDAWAHGASNEHSDFGPVKNPYNLERVPGGSSGGSAAAVASNQTIFSIGSDTGGSIRQPASFCGVYGLKPTYGSISRYGLIAMASSLDIIGPIAKSAEDTAIVFEAISGKDKKDSTTIEQGRTLLNLERDIKGLKVGLPKEYFGEGIEKEVKKSLEEALEVLENLGVQVLEISLSHTKYTVPTYYIIQPAEVSSNLSRYDGVKYGFSAQDVLNLNDTYFKSRAEGLGDEAKRRIMLGTYTLSSGYYDAYYKKAMEVRALIRKDFDEAFKQVDLIITPTSPTTAFKLGEKEQDPIQMYLADIFTAGANLAGIPGISVPCGFSKEGLPIGMQILAKQNGESLILSLSQAFESKTAEESWRKASLKV